MLDVWSIFNDIKVFISLYKFWRFNDLKYQFLFVLTQVLHIFLIALYFLTFLNKELWFFLVDPRIDLKSFGIFSVFKFGRIVSYSKKVYSFAS